MEHYVQLRKDTTEKIYERLNQLEGRINSEEFVKTSGTTNTVNYWVFDYHPKHELIVRERVSLIQKKYNDYHDKLKIYVVDLYELIIRHLESNNYIGYCKQFEQENGLDYVTAAVKNSLQLTSNEQTNAMVGYIKDIVPAKEAYSILLTGVGKCFPLLQGPEVFNQILYNMPDEYRRIPIVLFYPGTYTEQELIIFNEMQEDNFYRAYRIVRD
ncbi:MAG: DUF1788 domain-containing protein [Schwartzia succinivorans]|jgi:hypothetical protein|uniref:DUF1788 domain-containing protein n=1 Tax=Schwartzia succinivorans TaxID=55507 RepID=UPI00235683FA|nr:DUF1788 domain-containing protein [Schwartzia succinivorans]MBE6098023.1 DUF1788 domain-containing protein [Schwartzia succinivorans]